MHTVFSLHFHARRFWLVSLCGECSCVLYSFPHGFRLKCLFSNWPFAVRCPLQYSAFYRPWSTYFQFMATLKKKQRDESTHIIISARFKEMIYIRSTIYRYEWNEAMDNVHVSIFIETLYEIYIENGVIVLTLTVLLLLHLLFLRTCRSSVFYVHIWHFLWKYSSYFTCKMNFVCPDCIRSSIFYGSNENFQNKNSLSNYT